MSRLGRTGENDLLVSRDDFRRTVLLNAPDQEDLDDRMRRIKRWKTERAEAVAGQKPTR